MSEFAPVLNVAVLDGSNGFRLDGDSAYDYTGTSVSGGGDVNGDGFDDFLLSAIRADSEWFPTCR
ncbi:MAG TPA: integrin alpha [Aestuariivirga sp.]|nr:integrin alpha [Aestuariivirga sp.]